ncbi:hypothetical protein Acsp01_68130 [Actinoplanes sp. NBRC 101535]|nr:hypothetical protein Acsp01_68130 [Actinoplanes sp. NBRC 101535]
MTIPPAPRQIPTNNCHANGKGRLPQFVSIDSEQWSAHLAEPEGEIMIAVPLPAQATVTPPSTGSPGTNGLTGRSHDDRPLTSNL